LITTVRKQMPAIGIEGDVLEDLDQFERRTDRLTRPGAPYPRQHIIACRRKAPPVGTDTGIPK
jgi:hypothetical protein